MLHPQGNYPQAFNPFYPQGLNPQGLYPQGGFNYPQAGFQPGFVQGASPLANWQHPAQQAVQQLLAHQLGAQLGTPGMGGAISGLSNGTGAQATGAWPQHAWAQYNNPGQINPTAQQQWTQQQWTQQPSFQQLAQHHYAIAQQLLQLAAQQTFQGTANPYAGQFMPGQTAPFIPAAMGGSFVPGITMH
jgi:hypothetical protein